MKKKKLYLGKETQKKRKRHFLIFFLEKGQRKVPRKMGENLKESFFLKKETIYPPTSKNQKGPSLKIKFKKRTLFLRKFEKKNYQKNFKKVFFQKPALVFFPLPPPLKIKKKFKCFFFPISTFPVGEKKWESQTLKELSYFSPPP